MTKTDKKFVLTLLAQMRMISKYMPNPNYKRWMRKNTKIIRMIVVKEKAEK